MREQVNRCGEAGEASKRDFFAISKVYTLLVVLSGWPRAIRSIIYLSSPFRLDARGLCAVWLSRLIPLQSTAFVLGRPAEVGIAQAEFRRFPQTQYPLLLSLNCAFTAQTQINHEGETSDLLLIFPSINRLDVLMIPLFIHNKETILRGMFASPLGLPSDISILELEVKFLTWIITY